MKKLLLTLLIIGVVGGASAPFIADHLISTKITQKLDSSLAQSMSYQAMDASYLDETIVFNDIVLYDNNKPESQFNISSQQLTLHVDYNSALMKDFQVNQIIADNVQLNLTYQGKGDSNLHRLQQNLRHYLNNRPYQAEEDKATWDVYDIVLNDITVNIHDNELGDVGSFKIPRLVLPHVSSTYSKGSNRDTLLFALVKEISQQALNGTLEGNYSKMKAMQFAQRELTNEAGKVGSSFKEKAISKAKDFASGLLEKMKSNNPE